jgi:hypothetical protein
MTWFSLVSTYPRSCCDVLRVKARILAFTDRIGRSSMKLQTYHLAVPRVRRRWMRNPRNGNPSLGWVTRVLDSGRRSPSVASPAAICSRTASVSCLVPSASTAKSSAYAESRVMPILVPDLLAGAVSGFPLSA